MLKKVILTLLVFFSPTLIAHDYWLEAEKFLLQSGETLKVHLLVGDDLKADEERPLQKSKTLSFDLYTPKGKENLLTQLADSALPVLHKKMENEGLGLLTMERDFSQIILEDEKFESYLHHEHLIGAMEQRLKNGKRKQERERYARSIKCLFKVGKANPKNNNLFSKVIGQKIELILLQNPYALTKGDLLEAQLFFKGQPLPKTAVMALYKNREGKTAELINYTDDEGKVLFRIKESGLWVIRTTHLFPCEGCQEVDWESHWASFSFAIP